jgi:hypothetical protein
MLALTLCRTLYATMLSVAALAGLPPSATAQTDFYAFGPSDLRGPPGTLIRSEIVSAGPANARSYRVLYRSLGMEGRTTAVSGMVMIPISPPPADGRPIAAWAHPTTA